MALEGLKRLKWWGHSGEKSHLLSHLSSTQPERPQPRKALDYQLLTSDDPRVDATFARLRGELLRRGQARLSNSFGLPPAWRVSFGRLAVGPVARPYCYVQKWNEQGWLFEQTDNGWLIAPADQNALTDSFLRSNLTWDQVSLWHPEQQPDGLLRLRSERLSEELLSFQVYEDLILKELGMGHGDTQS